MGSRGCVTWGAMQKGLLGGLLLEDLGEWIQGCLCGGWGVAGRLWCSLLVAASVHPCLHGPVAFFSCVSLDPNTSPLRRT